MSLINNWHNNVRCTKADAKEFDSQYFFFNYNLIISSMMWHLSNSYKPIVEFIDAQFEAFLQEELKIKRTLHSYHDTRIHACLYFIAPTGHSLKSLDLVTMKKLDSKVSTDFIKWLPPVRTIFEMVLTHFQPSLRC